MNDIKSKFDTEIDLVDTFLILWEKKLFLIGFVSLSVILVFFYEQTKPRYFFASTNLDTMSIIEEEKYRLSNSNNVFDVSSTSLLNLYVSQLEEGSVFEQAAEKYELINAENYENETSYKEDIKTLVASIEITKGNYKDERDNNSVSNWQINFNYTDKEKWKNVLRLSNDLANERVRKTLIKRFEGITNVALQKKFLEIEKIETQIENASEDYEMAVIARIEYLKEQATIARKLNIEKSYVPPNTTLTKPNAKEIITESGMVTNIQVSSETEVDLLSSPFYYLGFIAIEAEIDLLSSRTNKDAFVSDLITLKQNKRALIQDTSIESAKLAFDSTPVFNGHFTAASIKVASTNFTNDESRILPLLITIVISGLVAVIHILLWNVVRQRYENS